MVQDVPALCCLMLPRALSDARAGTSLQKCRCTTFWHTRPDQSLWFLLIQNRALSKDRLVQFIDLLQGSGMWFRLGTALVARDAELSARPHIAQRLLARRRNWQLSACGLIYSQQACKWLLRGTWVCWKAVALATQLERTAEQEMSQADTFSETVAAAHSRTRARLLLTQGWLSWRLCTLAASAAKLPPPQLLTQGRSTQKCSMAAPLPACEQIHPTSPPAQQQAQPAEDQADHANRSSISHRQRGAHACVSTPAASPPSPPKGSTCADEIRPSAPRQPDDNIAASATLDVPADAPWVERMPVVEPGIATDSAVPSNADPVYTASDAAACTSDGLAAESQDQRLVNDFLTTIGEPPAQSAVAMAANVSDSSAGGVRERSRPTCHDAQAGSRGSHNITSRPLMPRADAGSVHDATAPHSREAVAVDTRCRVDIAGQVSGAEGACAAPGALHSEEVEVSSSMQRRLRKCSQGPDADEKPTYAPVRVPSTTTGNSTKAERPSKSTSSSLRHRRLAAKWSVCSRQKQSSPACTASGKTAPLISVAHPPGSCKSARKVLPLTPCQHQSTRLSGSAAASLNTGAEASSVMQHRKVQRNGARPNRKSAKVLLQIWAISSSREATYIVAALR
jgi:hypothetical protein